MEAGGDQPDDQQGTLRARLFSFDWCSCFFIRFAFFPNNSVLPFQIRDSKQPTEEATETEEEGREEEGREGLCNRFAARSKAVFHQRSSINWSNFFMQGFKYYPKSYLFSALVANGLFFTCYRSIENTRFEKDSPGGYFVVRAILYMAFAFTAGGVGLCFTSIHERAKPIITNDWAHKYHNEKRKNRASKKTHFRGDQHVAKTKEGFSLYVIS